MKEKIKEIFRSRFCEDISYKKMSYTQSASGRPK
jgi:hypothetical protein